jgi:hypothetical protein
MLPHRLTSLLLVATTAVFLTFSLFSLLYAQPTPPVSPASKQPTARLIVTLSQPVVAEGRNRRMVQSEQNDFLTAVAQTIPHAKLAYYVNEKGEQIPLRYSTLLNGVVLQLPQAELTATQQALAQWPQVTAVSQDRLISPTIFAAIPYLGVPELWENPAIGGADNAGAGVRVASMDWGTHPDAIMFDGTGYNYPDGYPLGDPAHTNGKIIVARAYFRAE